MPITAVLAAGLLLFPHQQQKSYFETICPNPTGHNGYEEYLAACDVFRKGADTQYMEAYAKVVPGDLGWLNTQRRFLTQIGNSLDLVKAGNAKDVVDPRTTFNGNTLFPELATFKSLEKALVTKANVQFADGQSRDAARTLQSGLVFSQKLQGTASVLGYLVGAAMQSIALSGYRDNLSRLPLPDVEAMLKDGLMNLSGNAIQMSLIRDAQVTGQMLDTVIMDRSKFSETFGKSSDLGENDRVLVAMNDVQFAQTVREAKRLVEAKSAKVIAVLGSPEAKWADQVKAIESNGQEPTTPAEILASEMTLGPGVVLTELKRRTQLRLLRVHLMIQRHRINANRLPDDLGQLGDQNFTNDPLTGRPFVYEKLGDRYELYSKGTPSLGRIDLVYKRDAVIGGQDDAPIRP